MRLSLYPLVLEHSYSVKKLLMDFRDIFEKHNLDAENIWLDFEGDLNPDPHPDSGISFRRCPALSFVSLS